MTYREWGLGCRLPSTLRVGCDKWGRGMLALRYHSCKPRLVGVSEIYGSPVIKPSGRKTLFAGDLFVLL
jgi:hypothetical protein